MCLVLLISACLEVASAAGLDTADDTDDGGMHGRKLLAKYKCGCRCRLPVPATACH